MNTAVPDFRKFEDILNYRFNHIELLTEAMRHSSFVNEQNDDISKDNERLEFLGDAVLNLVVGHILMRDHPDMKEGEMSRIRANMVNETQLADLARTIDLGVFLLLGKGEQQSNGMEKNSLLANAFEALIAAVYLDKGYRSAFDFIERLFKPLLVDAPQLSMGLDYKSRLQETVQSIGKETPVYEVVKETGPDHDKTFHVVMRVEDLETSGIGKSKKNAEQDAARNALELINKKESAIMSG